MLYKNNERNMDMKLNQKLRQRLTKISLTLIEQRCSEPIPLASDSILLLRYFREI